MNVEVTTRFEAGTPDNAPSACCADRPDCCPDRSTCCTTPPEKKAEAACDGSCTCRCSA